ncbi:MAG: LysR family transcriptional regulator [Burkholderiales bacterium PBB2]|nr:MAG: LysR family transcriptional regulator [Burkholderiales bacterium PBB2]
MQKRMDSSEPAPAARLDAQQFDWALLRGFLAIYRAGSVAAAARSQQLQQPTLSRQLIELEAQLGTRLFERSRRGLHPTAAAEQILEHALQMEEAASRLSLRLSARREQLSGTVRLHTTQLLAGLLVPEVLPGLLAARPGLQIELICGDAPPDLLAREADIGLWVAEPPRPLDLVCRRLGEFQIQACASPAYLARHGEPKDLAQLLAQQHRLVGPDKLPEMRRWFEQVAPELNRAHFVLRTDDKAALLQALKAGVGIGFAASYLVGPSTGLQRILPALPLPQLPLWLVTHREIVSNPLIRSCFDGLAEDLVRRL